MKSIDFEGLDTDIHMRIFGLDDEPARRPLYSREADAARALVDCINKSGQFCVKLSRVVGQAHRAEDWQCEVLTADGMDNLATEYDPVEALAICRAIAHANIRLTE